MLIDWLVGLGCFRVGLGLVGILVYIWGNILLQMFGKILQFDLQMANQIHGLSTNMN